MQIGNRGRRVVACLCAAMLSGCYTAAPELVLRTDKENVNPRKEVIAAEQKEVNDVKLRVIYLDATDKFLQASATDLWPAGTFDAKKLEGALKSEDVPILATSERKEQEVAVKLRLEVDGKKVPFKYVGVTANFAEKSGTWRICLPLEEVAKYSIVIDGNNLVKRERERDRSTQ